MVKTVKELADEMGVPKYLIHNLVASMGLRDKMTKSGNRFVLDESQMSAIKKAFYEQSGEMPDEENAEPAPPTDETPESATGEGVDVDAEATSETENGAKELPYFMTISERTDNRELRFNVIRLSGELDKEQFDRRLLQRDFDRYKAEAERTLADKIAKYENSAAANRVAHEKTLAAKDEQLDRMTATLAKLAPYFGEEIEKIEKPPKKNWFARFREKFHREKIKKL